MARDLLDRHEVETLVGTSMRTGTARVDLRDGDARYDFDLVLELPAPDLDDVGHLHVGSVAAVLDPGAVTVADVVARAKRRGLPRSYDPNLRPGLVGPDTAGRVRSLAADCTLVKLSDADARLLDAEADPAATAASLLTGDTRVVVLTRGADGATGFTDAGAVDVPARPVEVVDTVGAGDAFMAGLLAHGHLPLREQLLGAATAAAEACSRAGA